MYQAVHHAAEFIELYLVVDHFGPVFARNRVVFSEIDCLLGANFLAKSAVDAAGHIDEEFLRSFLNLGEFAFGGEFTGSDCDRSWGTNKFAELAGDAALAIMVVLNQSRRTSVVLRQLRVPFFLGILHDDFRFTIEHFFEVLQCDQQPSDNVGNIEFFPEG